MCAQVWFKGNVVLLLHEATILSVAYDKQSIFSVLSNSVLKVVIGSYSKIGVIFEVNNEVVVETWVAKRCGYTNR